MQVSIGVHPPAGPWQFWTSTTTSSTSSTLAQDVYKPIPYFNIAAVEWALIFGVSLLLGVGMGANDVADAFGTSVGTRTVTLTQAFVLATIVEMMGSVAAGAAGGAGRPLKVVETTIYQDNPNELILGEVASLVGCSVWLIIATAYKMPVSSIHALLGSTIGFSVVLRGLEGIIWDRVAIILAIWILSPVISGVLTLITFFLLDIAVLKRKNPVESGLFMLPMIYFIVFFTNVFLLLQDGSRIFHFNEIPLMYDVSIAIFVAAVAGLFALFVVAPFMRRKLQEEHVVFPRIPSSLSNIVRREPKGLIRRAWYWAYPPMRDDDQKAVRLFSFLQLITACFAGFAHGANDVANALAPLKDLVQMYNQDAINTYAFRGSIYVGLFTALAVVLGIWTMGIRVLRTVSESISVMNPATGFSVEFGAAILALVTNTFNIPQSMTHCLVGSIIALGMVRSGPVLQWPTVKNVFLSWVLTIPVSGLISAAVMYGLQSFAYATRR